MHDVVESILYSLRTKVETISGNYKIHILDADLKECFAKIDHTYLLGKLNTSPKITKQINAWLKMGICLEFNTTPIKKSKVISENTMRTPQGGIISPFLLNVALHGMEYMLKEWITRQD